MGGEVARDGDEHVDGAGSVGDVKRFVWAGEGSSDPRSPAVLEVMGTDGWEFDGVTADPIAMMTNWIFKVGIDSPPAESKSDDSPPSG